MQCQKLKTNMETGRVLFLPLRAIHPNPVQPRTHFSPETMEELAASIRLYGILQPLTVRRTGTGYELIAGERRLRAAHMAGLSEVPCIVMQMDDRDSEMAAMVENLQRADLDFVEEAQGIRRMMQHWKLSQEQAAQAIGKSQSAVANKLRILRHGERVLTAIREAGLTERHARALLVLPDEERKIEAIREIKCRQMNVAKTEAYLQTLLRQPTEKRPAALEGCLRGLKQCLERMCTAGLAAVSERRETENEIVLTITIQKDSIVKPQTIRQQPQII